MRIAARTRGRIRRELAGVLACCVVLSGAARSAERRDRALVDHLGRKAGRPVTDVPESAVATLACGTHGGPTSIPLKHFADWRQCAPEASGLRELAFTYDDEKDYIARALELEFRALAGGTSVYAHPVVLSILVDDKGLAQGIRIVTDDRANDRDRRMAATLTRNFQARFGAWSLRLPGYPDAGGRAEGRRRVYSSALHGREPGWAAGRSC